MASSQRIQLANYLQGNGLGNRNYISNPSAFLNTTQDITLGAGVSAGDVTRNTTNPITAISDFQISFNSATNEFVEWAVGTIDRADLNGNCQFSGAYRLTLGAGATVQAQVRQGSTTVATLDLAAASTAQRFIINAPCGDGSSATTVRFAQTVAVTTSTLNVADLYYGRALNVGSVAQASVYGTATWAGTANCIWGTTSASFTNFAADTDCNNPTVSSNLTAPGTKIPGVVANNLPPGRYLIQVTAQGASLGGGQYGFRISDGTTNGSSVGGFTANQNPFAVSAVFEYTTAQSSVTWQLQGVSDGVNTAQVRVGSAEVGMNFIVSRFPTQDQQAVNLNQTNYGWTAYTPSLSAGFGSATNVSFLHRRNGENLEVIGSLTTGTVTATTANIGLPAGLEIDANKLSITNNTTASAGTRVGISTQQGSTNGGTIVTAPGTSLTNVYLGGLFTTGTTMNTPQNVQSVHSSSQSASYHFSVPIKGWSVNQNAPLLVGSVTSNSTGAERIERLQFGGSTPFTYTSICNSSPCTIWSQSGSWVSSVTRTSAGIYVINYTGFSERPTCTLVGWNGTATTGLQVMISNISTTQITTRIRNGWDSTDTDASVQIICMGPR